MELSFVLCEEVNRDKTAFKLVTAKSVRRSVEKRRWTPDENELLQRLVEQYGASRWNRFEQHFAGRKGINIRAHWKHHFESAESKRPFTAADDAKLLAAYTLYGPQWSRIAKSMDRRIDNDLKNRFQMLKRRSEPDTVSS